MHAKHTHLTLVNGWTDFLEDIGRAIKMKRLFAGISQEQMAYKTGIDYATLRAYEAGAGTITLEHLYRISLALGVNMYALIPECFY